VKVKLVMFDDIASVKALRDTLARFTAATPETMGPRPIWVWGRTIEDATAMPPLALKRPPKLAIPASTSDAHESTPENVADVPINAPDSVVAGSAHAPITARPPLAETGPEKVDDVAVMGPVNVEAGMETAPEHVSPPERVVRPLTDSAPKSISDGTVIPAETTGDWENVATPLKRAPPATATPAWKVSRTEKFWSIDGTAATAKAQSLAAHGGDESAIVYEPADMIKKDGVILGPEKINQGAAKHECIRDYSGDDCGDYSRDYSG
jgi:hypothetical protein